MGERILIGLGTGRCGTSSLARLLSLAENCRVGHECKFGRQRLTWPPSESAMEAVLGFLEGSERPVSGDVAFYYLPCARWIHRRRPDTRFICLRRDREETIESYMEKTEGRDHWSMLSLGVDPWDSKYPKFRTANKRTAIGMYWDMYYAEASRMEREGLQIKTFEMEALNEERGVAAIMNFAGLDPSAAIAGIRENKGRSV